MRAARISRPALGPGLLLMVAACGGGGGGGSSGQSYLVSGSVTGLAGAGFTVRVNSTNVTVSANGSVTLLDALPDGSAYSVTVVTQPSTPAQVCTVSNGSGTVRGGNVTNIAIACTTTPLSLSSSTPVSGANAEPRSVAPVLTFSAPLDATTANSSNVSLQSIAGNHAIVASVAGQSLTVTPSSALLPLAEHTLSISTGLRGAAGETLAAPVAVTFTTGDGQWKTPTLIETGNEPAVSPVVAFDASGNAIAVWQQAEGLIDSIWSNRYTAGGGWGTAELIETNITNATGVQIAVNGSGHAIAVWHQMDGQRESIYANQYTPGSGWGRADLIELDNAGPAAAPHVAIDPSGNGVAVWHQFDGTRFNAWSNRYTPGVGWRIPEFLESAPGAASSPRVAMDASGHALAVWQQSDGTDSNIYARRYVPGTGWEAPELIESRAGVTSEPRIVMNADGSALAGWRQFENEFKAWSNRYTPGSGWGVAERLGPEGASIQASPRVAIDARGNALAVWQHFDGARDQIWSNRYAAGSGWTGPTVIPNDDLNDASEPQIAIDPAGNALAVWYQMNNSSFHLWWSRYSTIGWTKAAPFAGDDQGGTLLPQIAIDANGNALCLAEKSDGSTPSIWSVRFD
jgi:hypothetical protein